MKISKMETGRLMLTSELVRCFYDLKSSSPGYIWVLVVFIPVSCLLVLEGNLDLGERQLRLAFLTEVISPILLGFFANSLLMSEIELGSVVFPATRLALPVLWLRRIFALFLAYILDLVAILIIVNLFYPEIGSTDYILASLPTCLLISGLVSAFSFIFREMNAGYLAGIFLWSLNFIGARAALSVFGPRFYIFYEWASIKFSFPPDLFWTNKVIIAILGLAWCLLCILLLLNSENILVSKR